MTTRKINWVKPLVYINPDELQTIVWEPTSYCNLRCITCSRINRETMLPKSAVLQFQRHFPLSLVDSIFANLPSLYKVKFDGDIGDALMHPRISDICDRIVKLYPNIILSISTNGTSGKDENFKKVILNKNVMIILGIDGLEDTCHLYRRGAQWKVIKRRLEMIRTYAPYQHKWKFLVFDFNKHQVDEARQMAHDYKFKLFETHTPYADSRKETKQVLDEIKSGKRHKNGGVALFKDKVKNPEKYGTDKNGVFLKPNKIDDSGYWKALTLTESNQVQDDKTYACPWKTTKEVQIMSDGQVWPCCWTSFMAVYSRIGPKEIWLDKDNFYRSDENAQWHIRNWYDTLGNNWIKDITVTKTHTLRDVLLGLSYSRLASILSPKKGKYHFNICNKTCRNLNPLIGSRNSIGVGNSLLTETWNS